MNILFTVSANPTYTGDWRASAYETTNLGAEVAFTIIPGPHNVAEAVSILNVDRKPHVVIIRQVSSNTILSDFLYQPMDTDYEVYSPIFFKIGDGGTYTPVAGSTQYRNPFLEGKDYWVERRGMGTLHEIPLIEITKVEADPDFGFDLALDGDQFYDGEHFVIHFLPKKVMTAANDSIAGKWFKGTVEVTATRSYLDSDLRNLLLLRGAGSTITYTLPAAILAPIGYVFGFQTFGSGWTSHVIASPSVNINDKTGAMVNQVTIAANQFLYLVFDGTRWEIVAASDLLPFTISDNPDENDAAKVASTVATKVLADRIKIIATGKFNIGDVPGGDPAYSQSFSNPGNADYVVMGSFKSNNSNHARDNTITWAWYKDEVTPHTKFKVIMQELNGEAQNVEFCYLVVKI